MRLRSRWGVLGSRQRRGKSVARARRGATYYNHKPVMRGKTLGLPLELNPGLPLRQIVTWDRGSGINWSRAHYLPRVEWILVLARPTFAVVDQRAPTVSDLWAILPESGSPHPAPLPLALPARAIETTGARCVFDPSAASGTTLLAAKMAGATAIGVELEERFCEMAARRLSQDVLPLGDENSSAA
jgi:hypothetical protein